MPATTEADPSRNERLEDVYSALFVPGFVVLLLDCVSEEFTRKKGQSNEIRIRLTNAVHVRTEKEA